MTIKLQQIFETPDQYLFTFENEDAIFVEMDREAYYRSIFLDRRISPKGATGHRVRAAALIEQLERAKPSPLCYIFHVAHCGSTLLARALDVAEANLVYREPMTLRYLGVLAAGTERAAAPADGWQRRMRLATAMLGRRYNAAGPAIVKANVPVNFMLSELMQLDPQQPAILLYATLENYLLAVLRSSDHQSWVGRVTGEVGAGIGRQIGGFDPDSGVAKAAAQLWLAQALIFAEALRRFPNVVSLDAETFFAQPGQAVAAAFAHFGQPRTEAEIAATIGSDLFSRYSKNPQLEFSNARRLGLREQSRAELRSQIDEARRWLTQRPGFERLPKSFERPLVGEGGELSS
ncbi:MAG: hypothetical protein AB7T59_16245 [Hyphomonadaceae bacterium]